MQLRSYPGDGTCAKACGIRVSGHSDIITIIIIIKSGKINVGEWGNGVSSQMSATDERPKSSRLH